MVLTIIVVILALIVVRGIWRYYMNTPWTRDAHVAVEVTTLAPDVSGLVTAVKVHDYAQVKKGQELFEVDPERYRMAVEQASSALASRRSAVTQAAASVDELKREVARDRSLGNLVATEEAQSRRSRLAAAEADLKAAQSNVQTAQAALDLAHLNLRRTIVRSPVDGHLNDRVIRLGSYAHAGQNVLAIVDTQSLHIDAYMEESRLEHVHPGQQVDIKLMGERRHLKGHVRALAAGIEDRYRTESSRMLPNVTPNFEWVRLAQRIPVAITIDEVPKGVDLIAGRTATVHILTDRKDHDPRNQSQQSAPEQPAQPNAAGAAGE